jgi:hypothetical protein
MKEIINVYNNDMKKQVQQRALGSSSKRAYAKHAAWHTIMPHVTCPNRLNDG